ncbi:MAG: hypothetical protein E7619_04905 [Ruminococcaceae bacterium]|nr:hypothetical protein [Oscillospiraceae bacterium]
MTYEIYRYIFIGAAILSAIMFAVTVFVFFFLKIPTVIGDLTGANARKAIEEIRNHNERTGHKTHHTSAVNRERGKLTEKISQSGRLIKDHSDSLHGAMGTEKIGTDNLAAAGSETTLLEGSETTLLGGSETTLLSDNSDSDGETTKLSAHEPAPAVEAAPLSDAAAAFTVEYEITYIHTSEFIE